MLIGAVIGIIGGVLENFLFWYEIGVYGLIFSILITIVEYPRGKKIKGRSQARFAQEFVSVLVDKLPVTKNYYYRVLIYFVVCIPACLIPPTFFGAVCIILGCVIYVIAGRNGETWIPIDMLNKSKAKNLHVPPSRPPPRLPQTIS